MNSERYPCVVCQRETPFYIQKEVEERDKLARKRATCTRCWELGGRISDDPKLARRFLEAVEAGYDWRSVRV